MSGHVQQCQTWEPSRCQSPAEVRMFAPDGVMVPGGFYCRAHAEATVSEYAAKLSEHWTLRPLS